eukprot:2447851-Prymnesium_polylepis.1
MSDGRCPAECECLRFANGKDPRCHWRRGRGKHQNGVCRSGGRRMVAQLIAEAKRWCARWGHWMRRPGGRGHEWWRRRRQGRRRG